MLLHHWHFIVLLGARPRPLTRGPRDSGSRRRRNHVIKPHHFHRHCTTPLATEMVWICVSPTPSHSIGMALKLHRLTNSRLGAWAVGNCTGPVIGGAIAQTTTWRWVFYLMFPLCFVGLALVLYLLKFRTPSATASQKVQRVDWTGGICFIASATILLVAISWGGSQFSWASTGTLIPLCLGLVGLLGTMVYEAKLALRPFLRRSLFHDASSVITYLCGTIQGFLVSFSPSSSNHPGCLD